MTTIVWFRRDLRLHDHLALRAAAAKGPVIPLFIAEPVRRWAPGGASRWWLHHSLAALDASLKEAGSRLILRQGEPREVLKELIAECGATAVHWSRRYDPEGIETDTSVKTALKAAGMEAESFSSALLFEPWDIRNGSGEPYKVFTPFWKACLSREEPAAPTKAPKLEAPSRWPASLALQALKLLPRLNWASEFSDHWTPGERGARRELDQFLTEGLSDYMDGRDYPDRRSTSCLSPHLHFGELSPRQLWHAAMSHIERPGGRTLQASAQKFLAEVGWREFAHHLLFHFAHTPEQPLRAEFARFPWRRDAAALRAWQQGNTGYPIVDAGMRQLWRTGWMHNRVRMIVASFLVKHLLIPWTEGAAWFWDTLVDADLANNTLGWQWTAGCGADAAPYFRIFNPVLQGEKFDPDGAYVRRFVPELAKMPAKHIHQPWNASDDVLRRAGVVLDRTYPTPIVDHATARERALAAFAAMPRTP